MTEPRLMRFENFVEINPRVRLQRGDEYPFIDMKLLMPDNRYVRPQNGRSFEGGGTKFQNQDTLFARITPCLENGKIAQVIDLQSGIGFGSTEFFVFRARPKISVPAYVYYLASTSIIRGPAEKSMSGASGRQRADLSAIQELQILAPDVQTQQQIVAILSAYDDLIDKNLRRIKILEEMAQNLYREWFVKFRFPGHEQTRMVDSPLGKIPEGWKVMPISKAVYLNPKLNIEKEKAKIFVPMSGLSKDSMIITEYEYRKGSNGAKFQNGDTLFARITPSAEHGKIGFVQCLTSNDEVAFGSTEYIVMRSTYLNPYVVYFLARELDLREHAIRSMTGASGRQRVQVGCFDNFLIATSTQDILEKFEKTVAPNFRLIQNLWGKNQALRQTRDLLLPKLISGELDVSKLDIDIRDAA